MNSCIVLPYNLLPSIQVAVKQSTLKTSWLKGSEIARMLNLANCPGRKHFVVREKTTASKIKRFIEDDGFSSRLRQA